MRIALSGKFSPASAVVDGQRRTRHQTRVGSVALKDPRILARIPIEALSPYAALSKGPLILLRNMKTLTIMISVSVALSATATPVAHAEKSRARSTGKQKATESFPSFRKDVLPALVQNCANAAGCHGDHATESVSLDLREQAAYGQLVEAPSVIRKGSMRVARGKPKESFLVDKLTGELSNTEGKRMPLDDQSGLPLILSPLLPDYVEKVLKPWIQAGAPDN